MTGYLVLKARDDNAQPGAERGPTWDEIGPPVEAVSAEAAIRKAVTDGGGTFAAIPVRSFKPVTVKVETTRKLTLA